jgi:hypothetical protein
LGCNFFGCVIGNPQKIRRARNKNKMSFDELPELLTIRDVTALLNVHANTLRNWEREGLISAVRIGPRKDRRYKKEIIKDIMTSS